MSFYAHVPGLDAVFTSIDDALFAQEGDSLAAEAMLNTIGQEVLWRQQWRVVAQAWALHHSQPWIEQIEFSASVDHSSVDTQNGQDAVIDTVLLAELLEKAPQLPPEDPRAPILTELLNIKQGPNDDRDFVTRIAMADAIEALPWARFHWKDEDTDRLHHITLRFDSHESVARALLDDESFAAWERASLSRSPNDPAQTRAAAEEKMATPTHPKRKTTRSSRL